MGINVTQGASETIHDHEYVTSTKRAEAFYKRRHGWTCLVLAREGYRQRDELAYQAGALSEGLMQGLQGTEQ